MSLNFLSLATTVALSGTGPGETLLPAVPCSITQFCPLTVAIVPLETLVSCTWCRSCSSFLHFRTLDSLMLSSFAAALLFLCGTASPDFSMSPKVPFCALCVHVVLIHIYLHEATYDSSRSAPTSHQALQLCSLPKS